MNNISGSIEMFWQKFLSQTNRDKNIKYSDCFQFGQSADELLDLVLKGIKKATSSSLWAYELESERLPQVGDLSVVTDSDGNPKCVIEIMAVTIILFGDVTYDICKREGEDQTLQTWQKNHRDFFTEEGKDIGYEFSLDMPIVFEDFKVVYEEL